MVTEKNPEVIGGMFNRIARRYDLLNHLLSMGIDKRWRRALVRELVREKAGLVLDMATGTADLALMAVRAGIDKVKGVDIADAMLDIGRNKIRKAGLDARISLQNGRAEEIPFEDHTFDGAMVAFGVRNFEDLDKGLKEMHRVLKPGGSIRSWSFPCLKTGSSVLHTWPISAMCANFRRVDLRG
jgi:demethylmenaquinone methyltransferase/2-methoxy-6-polyprenyl-1,4-benzoquinol methylase